MSILDKIFGRATPQPQQQQPLHNPPPTQNNLQTPPNPTVGQYPPASPGDVTSTAGQPPAAKFADLWTPPKEGEGLQQPKLEEIPTDALMQAAQKFDPTTSIDPAKLQLAVSGGEGAAAAMLDIIRQASQASYQQGILGAQKLAEKQAANQVTFAQQQARNEAVRQQAQQALEAQFNNPLVAPFVAQTVQQLQLKNPKASPTELQQMAKDAMLAAASVLSPTKPPESPKPNAGDDWSAYAGL